MVGLDERNGQRAQVADVIQDVRRVYEAEHERLWRSLYAFSRSREVADEAVAEAFAQLLRRGADVEDGRGWVWRSAFAIARGELQRHAARPRPLTDAESDRLAALPVEAALRSLLDALGEMSVDDRELLVLCHVGGWKPGELAPLLGASGATLRVRLHRATKRARTVLEQEDT